MSRRDAADHNAAYGADYRRRRAELIGLPCIWCGAEADTADHVPPLASAPSVAEWDGDLHPACRRCNSSHRAAAATAATAPPPAAAQRRRHVVVP